MKFLVPIDLNKNEVRNARIQNLATAPSSPVAGQIYFDTNSDQLNFWDGTTWVNAGGVAQSGIDELNDVVITTVQDRDFLVYDSGSSAWVNSTVDLGDLADVDTSGAAADKALVYNGTTWVAVNYDLNSLSNVTITGATAADVLYWNGSAWVNQALDTDDVAEGTNLYYTDARADGRIAAASVDDLSDVDLSQDALSDGLGYPVSFSGGQWRRDTLDPNALSDSTTDALTEGSTNLYYTDGRADGRIAAASIDDLSDVSSAGAESGEFLVFDGTNWSRTRPDVTDLEPASGDYSFGGNKITNLGTPSDSTDAATKAYVDAVAEGLHIHASVDLATTGPLASLENAVSTNSDLPNTLIVTFSSAGIWVPIDGVNVFSGQRILVKDGLNGSDPEYNGIYTVTEIPFASGWTDLILERADDYNTSAEVQAGDFVFVSGGSTYDSTGWVQTETVNSLNTDAIQWTQFSGSGTYTAGTGLTLSGPEFSITPGGVTATEIATGAVDTDELATDAVTTIKITDLNVTTDKLAGGAVTNAKLADDAVQTNNILNGNVTEAKLDTTLANKINAKTDKVTTNVGDGSATSFAIAHGFGEASVTVYENATNAAVFVDVVNDPSTAGGTVTVSFATAPASNAYRVVVVG